MRRSYSSVLRSALVDCPTFCCVERSAEQQSQELASAVSVGGSHKCEVVTTSRTAADSCR
jgi:hypothetical protein